MLTTRLEHYFHSFQKTYSKYGAHPNSNKYNEYDYEPS